MAIDPRISLAQPPPLNIGQRFGQALQNVSTLDALQRNRELAPLQQERAELALQQARTQAPLTLEQAQREAELQTVQQPGLIQQAQNVEAVEAQKSIALFTQQSLPSVRTGVASGDLASFKQQATQRRDNLIANGRSTETVDAQLRLADENPALLLQKMEEDLTDAQNFGLLTRAPGAGIQSSQFIPGVGFATLTRGGEAGLVPVAGVGETAEVKREQDIQAAARKEQQKATIQGKSAAVKLAVKKGGAAFDRIQPLTTAILNYDEAIAAIDAGAETGVIASFLPSFKKASIELDNVVKRLGLDVVGSTTFGALSEGELAFALSAAIPKTLQPQELKEWLIAKRDAQKKVKERVEEAASFLSDGTHTLKDWIEFDQAKQLNIKNQEQTQSAINVIRFDAQGNIIQ